MYSPVTTYYGSSRNSRSKPKTGALQHQQPQLPSQQFLLGQLPTVSTQQLPFLSRMDSQINMPLQKSPKNFDPIPKTRTTSPLDRVIADKEYTKNQEKLNKNAEVAYINRKNYLDNLSPIPIQIPKDNREIYKQLMSIKESTLPRQMGQANGNSTVALPSALVVEGMEVQGKPISPRLSLSQAESNPTLALPILEQILDAIKTSGQKTIYREESTMNYRENEQNLIVYSYDRNWLKNTSENRYSFTVLFDPGNLPNGFHYNTGVNRRFRNISRIELVKAILPAESLENVVIQTSLNANGGNSTGFGSTDTTYMVNTLSFPFINVSIDEFDGNNSGTDDELNRVFGNLQYDAQWLSDSNHNVQPGVNPPATTNETDSRGYLAMIPKFMKCQRVFYPTPLATLQKMTINLTRPNGLPLSIIPDQFDISGIFANTDDTNLISSSKFGNQNPTTPATNRVVTYLFIKTSQYFPRGSISQGDTIVVQGFSYTGLPGSVNSQGLQNLTNWITRPQGNIVVGLGNDTSGSFVDGPNTLGYCNYIIIQSQYSTSGLISTVSVGNSLDINTGNSYLSAPPRRLLNQNRQTTLVFRIITRDLDSITTLRPDNTY